MKNLIFLIGTGLLSLILFCSGCGSGAKDVSFGVETDTSGDTGTTSDGLSVDISGGNSSVATSTTGTANGSSGDGVSSGDLSTQGSGRVWSVAEITAETRSGGSGRDLSCGGAGGFRHCVCPEDVPASIRYRPAVAECDDNAGIILDGRYTEAFSVVVRDSQNRDRWPSSGYNGCSVALANSDSPPNSCSVFKVQSEISLLEGKLYCLGASGYSDLFSDVTRITIKLGDDPNSNNDPIERFCILGPTLPLN